jgi:ABC-type multidrug transport system fused ATPase/permease subunit
LIASFLDSSMNRDAMVATQQPPSQKPSGLFRKLARRFLKRHRSAIAWALVGLVAQSLLLLTVPLLHGAMVDSLLAALADTASRSSATAAILTAGFATLLCYLGRWGFHGRAATVMSRVSLEVVRDLTTALHRQMIQAPLSYYDRRQTGGLMSRITSDVGSILIFLSNGSLQLVGDLLLSIGVSATLVILDWRLALASFAILPWYVLVFCLFAKRLEKFSRHLRSQVSSLFALLSERLTAIRIIRAFHRETQELAELDGRAQRHLSSCQSILTAGAWQSALASLFRAWELCVHSRAAPS